MQSHTLIYKLSLYRMRRLSFSHTMVKPGCKSCL